MQSRSLVSLCVVAILLLVSASQAKKMFSVSGISAGGFMAVQVGVAYSSQVEGVGVFAGGPYYCSGGQMTTALTSCMSMPAGISVDSLVDQTRQFASQDKIDSVEHIEKQNVYVFSGKVDSTVKQGVGLSLADYYRKLKAQVLNTQFDLNAEHCVPTDNYGAACAHSGSPWLNNCDYSGAGAALQTIYGKDAIKRGTQKAENLKQLDQNPPSGASLSQKYYVYIPDACKNGTDTQAQCKVHVNFHGCHQGYQSLGDTYVKNNGLNDFAEASNIIVVYPQVQSSYWAPMNPQGCFDWFGYSGSDFAFKQGTQMKFAYQLVEQYL